MSLLDVVLVRVILKVGEVAEGPAAPDTDEDFLLIKEKTLVALQVQLKVVFDWRLECTKRAEKLPRLGLVVLFNVAAVDVGVQTER